MAGCKGLWRITETYHRNVVRIRVRFAILTNSLKFLKMSVTILMRHYLSISHLSAAALFARQCHDIESDAIATPIDSNERRQHNAYAVSSIIVSTAFLEATINELFSDCADAHTTGGIAALPAKDIMGRLWKIGVPRTASYTILEKYEIALELNNKPVIDKGCNPYQDVKLLVELRNALIHYEPETFVSYNGNESPKLHKFEKRLTGKFSINPLTGVGNPFYPDKLLGSGCALWAVKTAVAFTDEFFKRLDVPANYDHIRPIFSK
ncbi:hypothetical protein [Aeromonas sp. s1(2024)]|uniref:hypothetical protein n=1 Tax=Aeromonas sp. s1(2024) TaxID=3138495 RepID=UPI0034A5197C